MTGANSRWQPMDSGSDEPRPTIMGLRWTRVKFASQIFRSHRPPTTTLRSLFPPAGLGRTEHGVNHSLCLQGILEGRLGRLVSIKRIQKVCDLVDEGVFEPDGQARHPPMGHVRMLSVRNMDRSPAAERAFVLVVEPLQPVQIVQIPGERSMFAIDLQGIKRLMAPRIAGCLEGW